MKFLVTGASGFVGTALTQAFTVQGFSFVRFNRTDNAAVFTNHAISAVIHLAARVHVMRESAADPLAEFRQSNVTETLSLARRAAAAGVKRFVYISSVKVNGEQTTGTPFNENDAPQPSDPYGISKYEAEQGLAQLVHETGLEVIIIRPPLVYGAGVKANFALLAKMAGKGIPLPLGAIHNQRSMIYVGNLVDFLILCAQPSRSPLNFATSRAPETFLISDGQDATFTYSTTYLLKTLAQAQGKPARLLPVPASWLKFALNCVGKSGVAQRLLGDLHIDSTKARTLLGWQPPYTVAQGLAASVV